MSHHERKESQKVEEFIDLVWEVISVANQLMLGRICQVYQKIIGCYGKWFLGHPMYPWLDSNFGVAIVNTRKAVYILMALAGCSENGFKDMCMQYVCLNMETMAENQ